MLLRLFILTLFPTILQQLINFLKSLRHSLLNFVLVIKLVYLYFDFHVLIECIILGAKTIPQQIINISLRFNILHNWSMRYLPFVGYIYHLFDLRFALVRVSFSWLFSNDGHIFQDRNIQLGHTQVFIKRVWWLNSRRSSLISFLSVEAFWVRFVIWSDVWGLIQWWRLHWRLLCSRLLRNTQIFEIDRCLYP